jgi:hypothetical protein
MSMKSISRKSSGMLHRYIQSHPLPSYFILAYVLAWLAVLPVVISQDGLNLVSVRLPNAPFITLGAFAGPALAAWSITYICEGEAGLKKLAQAMVRWKVSPFWYLVVLLGFPLLFLTGISVFMGTMPFSSVIQKPSFLVFPYGSTLFINIFQTTLWEEPGWRGFVLPRLL